MVIIGNPRYTNYTDADVDPCIFVDAVAHEAMALAQVSRDSLSLLKSSGILVIQPARFDGDIIYYIAKRDLIFHGTICNTKKGWKSPPCVIVNPSWITYWRHRLAIKFTVKSRLKELARLWPVKIHTTAESYDFRITDKEKETLFRVKEKFDFDPVYGVYSMTMEQMMEKGKNRAR